MPKYPRIDMMLHHKGSLTDFCDVVGISQSAYFALQRGETDPRKSTIDGVLAYTGLTYEQAFGKAGER